jgi:hypothetical protein
MSNKGVGLWGECNVNELMRNAGFITDSHDSPTFLDIERIVDKYSAQFNPSTLVFNGVRYAVVEGDSDDGAKT